MGVARAATTSAPDSSAEAGFASRIATERGSRGIGGLRMADDLTAVARRHSQEMAAQQHLSDDSNLATEVQGWQSLGGNAGEGPTVDQVHQAFMASPSHRANILEPNFSDLGVGVVWTGSTLWVTEVFRQPTTARAASAAPAPTPPPATSPRTNAPPPTSAPRPQAPRPSVAPTPPASPPTVAPSTTSSAVPLSAAAIPAPGEFAIEDRFSRADPGSRSLIALGPASLRLPGGPSRPLPAGYFAMALALLAVDLCALGVAGRAAARRRTLGQSLGRPVEPAAWR
jgi:hypothetical protein